MREVRGHLTYANVMVKLLAFVVLGGSAFALARNSIGSPEIKKNAVRASEIADGVVGSAEVADGAIGASEVRDGAIGTAAVANGTLMGEDFAPGQQGLTAETNPGVLFAIVTAAGDLSSGKEATAATIADVGNEPTA